MPRFRITSFEDIEMERAAEQERVAKAQQQHVTARADAKRQEVRFTFFEMDVGREGLRWPLTKLESPRFRQSSDFLMATPTPSLLQKR